MLGDENSVAADQTEGSGPSSSTIENDSESPPDGQTLAFALMLEMMDALEFPYTKKALQSESRHRRMALSREQLAKHIGLKSDEVRRAPSEQPLLVTLLEKVREERERNSADVASIPDDPEPWNICSNALVSWHGLFTNRWIQTQSPSMLCVCVLETENKDVNGDWYR